MFKLIWILRQSIPLTYRTHYRTADGQRWFCVWRMWMGRCFAVEHVAMADGNGGN
jgi:hypothetical protein